MIYKDFSCSSGDVSGHQAHSQPVRVPRPLATVTGHETQTGLIGVLPFLSLSRLLTWGCQWPQDETFLLQARMGII